MNWSSLVRHIHRWTSIIFTLLVGGIFVALSMGVEPVQWVYFLPLAPLAVLLPTGLYMFVLPYASRGRRAGTADA